MINDEKFEQVSNLLELWDSFLATVNPLLTETQDISLARFMAYLKDEQRKVLEIQNRFKQT